MTIFNVAGGERALTVRYLPILTWTFVVLAAYGCADIVIRLVDGRLAMDAGALLALAALIGLALFVLHAGGQFVVASFDRAGDLVRIQRYGLTGYSVTERPLSDLVGLDVHVIRRAQHRIELRFRSGERLPLTSYYVVSFDNRGLGRLSAMLGIDPNIVLPGQGR